MFNFWQRWLMLLADGAIAFGVILILFSDSWLFAPLNEATNTLFWGSAEAPLDVAPYQAFMNGLLGATTVGWGIALFFIAWKPFRQRERWAWIATAAGLAAWFALDSAVAATHGAWGYVAVNALWIVLAANPLAATAPHFFRLEARRTAVDQVA